LSRHTARRYKAHAAEGIDPIEQAREAKQVEEVQRKANAFTFAKLVVLRDRRDEKPYCLTGECSRDVSRCLTKRAPVASLILRPGRSSFSDF
jgi:hypothetical protein